MFALQEEKKGLFSHIYIVSFWRTLILVFGAFEAKSAFLAFYPFLFGLWEHVVVDGVRFP